MMERNRKVQLSVIVPVGARHSDLAELYAEYRAGIEPLRMSHEFIFVLDGPHPDVLEKLEPLVENGNLILVCLNRRFGESTALMAGFERASGDLILTLPAYHQVDGSQIGKLVAALDTADVAVGWRWPRAGGVLERLRRRAFHGLVGFVTGMRLHDLGCGARALKRSVLEELSLYGDRHRLLAILADRQGFKVAEIELSQSGRDRFEGVYLPGDYAHLILDVFTVFFLVRFTKKPLRFFGTLGATMFGAGGLIILYLVADRLLFGQSLSDRPALLLAALVVVLGLQLFALGLLAELIIFTHAQHLKDYRTAEIIQYPPQPLAARSPAPAALEKAISR
ncbi:MAG TPA: glycosyltransferase [Steroidobacteraceae bacterium]|nr:glycosyltransferase [Steroidobacteraceae bacterium]